MAETDKEMNLNFKDSSVIGFGCKHYTACNVDSGVIYINHSTVKKEDDKLLLFIIHEINEYVLSDLLRNDNVYLSKIKHLIGKCTLNQSIIRVGHLISPYGYNCFIPYKKGEIDW